MAKKKDETASAKVAKLAGKVLAAGKATVEEAKSLAGSVLTNAPEKPKAAAKPKAASKPKAAPKSKAAAPSKAAAKRRTGKK